MLSLKDEHIVLENEIVQLVPLNDSHSSDFINYALTQPTTWQFSLINPGGNAIAMQEYIAFANKEKLENKSYTFTVLHKPTNTIAGCTRFYDIDFNHKTLTIGYTWYGEQFRRTGINRNCKLLLLTYAFEVWNMQRVEFRADINNALSIAAMKAIGCIEEGILRSHSALADGTRRTSIILSILKEEWENGVKEKLIRRIY
jgi:RimJ/RimL family protein N-acetyltransferase